MKLHHFNYDISGDIRKIITLLESDLQEFNNKKILITGGTGFFGRWLLETLCTMVKEKRINISIYVISRNPQRFLQKHQNFPFDKFVTFITGNVTDFKLSGIKLDFLIHMATTAAEETYEGEDQLNKIDLLYRGTRNTLENAVAGGVKKVLFTSSGVVYGPSDGRLIKEDSLQAPNTTTVTSALGEGKRIAEFLVAYYASKAGYSYSIARCFAFAGQYLPLDLHYAFGNFVNDAIHKQKITITGAGKEIRSYLYIGDAITWLLKSLINSNNQIFNVGSSSEITIEELAKKICKEFKIKENIEIIGGNKSENFIRNFYVPCTKKIKSSLNVIEWTNIDQIILKMKNYDKN